MATFERLTESELAALVTPSGYCVARLGMTPYVWQQRAMDSVVRDYGRTALRTCNDSGKTSLCLTALVLWHMETFPGSLTVTTSGSYTQIVEQLYPNLKAHTAGDTRFRILKDRGEFIPTGSRLVSFSTDNAGRAEGWHEPPVVGREISASVNLLGEYGVSDAQWAGAVDASNNTSLLMVIDEAKSVEQYIFDAWERCHPTRFFVASSPGEPSGPFYDCFHGESHRYDCFHASWVDCPHLYEREAKRLQIEEQLRTKPKALTDSMVYGEFSMAASGMVFDMAAVSRAMSGCIPLWGHGTRRAAVDLSGGGDETCLFIADGNECWLDHTWRENDTMRLCDLLIGRFQANALRPEWINADNGGLGKPILDALASRGWALNRIDFGGSARDKESYANCRTEMFFELANRIKADEVRLPKDDALRVQLSWHKYKLTTKGKLGVLSKEKMPHSPDRADAVAMLYYMLPAANEYAERQEQVNLARSKTQFAPGQEPGYAEDVVSPSGLW